MSIYNTLFQTKALGNFNVAALTTAEVTSANAGTANVAGTKLNAVIAALTAYATPDC